MKFKTKAFPLERKCPECGDVQRFVVGFTSDPFELKFYARNINESGALRHTAPDSITVCPACKEEFRYKLQLVPAITIYKLTEIE